MMGWLKTFANPFLKPFPESFHEHILQEAETIIKPTLCDKDSNWHADYVRLRLLAYKQ